MLRKKAKTRWMMTFFVGVVAGWAALPLAAIIETALEQAAALRAEGRFDDALEALRIESRKIKTAEGDGSPKLLPINDLAVEILLDKGDFATASSLLAKTIAAREKLIADGATDQGAALGSSLVTLARLEASAKRWPAVIATGRQALLLLDGASDRTEEALARAQAEIQTAADMLEQMVGPGSDVSVATRDELASLFTSLGMIPQAIEQRRKILAGLEQRRPLNAPAMLQATDRLGRLMTTNGRAEEAIPIIEAVLAALGKENTVDSLAARRLLGDLQFAAGRCALAEASYAAVLEATQGDAKASAITLATDRLRGLLVTVRCGPAKRLPEWFDAAVKTLIRAGAPDATQAIAGLVAAARVRQELGEQRAAIELLDRALALAVAARVPDAGQIADLSGRLAAAQAAAGDPAAARKTAERALPVAERDAGPGSAQAGFLRLVLADALARGGESAEADALAARAIDRGLPRPDDAWEEMAVAICDRLASDDDGERDLRDAFIAARARQFGLAHPHVVAACGLFGAARLAAGDWPAAIDFFQRAVDVDSRGDHPERAANLVLEARAQHGAGEPTRAAETAAEGFAAWERIVGADHPGTLAAADVLVATKLQVDDMEGVVELLERLCATDTGDDPLRRASHLIRLATLTAEHDKPRAQELLQQARQLPCWQEGSARDPGVSVRLALTAALAAHAFTMVGDSGTATEMLQQARRLVMQAKDSAALLERVERIAAQGERP